jgi:hypothetical protein
LQEATLAKHCDPRWKFEPDYPLIKEAVFNEEQIEVLARKQSGGIHPERHSGKGLNVTLSRAGAMHGI